MNNISLILVKEFQKIFAGNINHFGQCIEKPKNSNGKVESTYYIEKKQLTEQDYINHLTGKKGLVLFPVFDTNQCRFSVIDVDIYDSQIISNLIEIIYSNNFPLVPFKSKSGGLHLYLFFSENILTDTAIEIMKKFKLLLGLSSKIEIFPKQTIITEKNIGNGINLPYFNSTTRHFVYKNNELCIIEKALEIIKEKIVSKHDIDLFFSELALSDAPPCLQFLYFQRDTINRNEFLFSLARYYKSKYGDKFSTYIIEANNRLKSPIDFDRLQKTIISSFDKKDYSYKCSTEPLKNFCNKVECKKRQYGIGNSYVNDLSYEELTQHLTDPPYYVWKINGKEFTFYSEQELIDQSKFRTYCMRELHIVPYKLKNDVWETILSTAFQNILIKEESKEELSEGSIFIDMFVDFFESRYISTKKEHVLNNKIFKDDTIQSFVFKRQTLISFLYNHVNFKNFSIAEINNRLKKLGVLNKRYYISSEHQYIRVLIFPFSSISEYINIENTCLIDFIGETKNKL